LNYVLNYMTESNSKVITLLIETIDFRLKAYKKELKGFKDKDKLLEITENCEMLNDIKQDLELDLKDLKTLSNTQAFMLSLQETLNVCTSYESLMNCERVRDSIKDNYIYSRLDELKDLIQSQEKQVPLSSLRTLLFLLILLEGAKTPNSLNYDELFYAKWTIESTGTLNLQFKDNYNVYYYSEEFTEDGIKTVGETIPATEFIYNLMMFGS